LTLLSDTALGTGGFQIGNGAQIGSFATTCSPAMTANDRQRLWSSAQYHLHRQPFADMTGGITQTNTNSIITNLLPAGNRSP